MDKTFCVEALQEALDRYGKPEIFNTDQGVQFTCEAFISTLSDQGIHISMDGKGRCLDNIFCERLWRSLKYEEVYLKAYATVAEARAGHRRMVRVLRRRTPAPSLGLSHTAPIFCGKSRLCICGQRKRVAHIYTGSTNTTKGRFT